MSWRAHGLDREIIPWLSIQHSVPLSSYAAFAASVANGCVLCASVHARHFNTHGQRPQVTTEIFTRQLDAELDERDAAIFAFSTRLAASPPAANAQDIVRLREVGLDDGEIADLIHAVALFGWASRLMRSLGEPLPAQP